MNFQEFQQLVAHGESLHAEFKEWPVHPEDLAAAIVAFANTDGGKLVLGVSDAGQVVGLADPDAVIRTVDNVARNNCLPPVPILQEKLTAPDGKEVLSVSVAKGDERPYDTNRG